MIGTYAVETATVNMGGAIIKEAMVDILITVKPLIIKLSLETAILIIMS